MITKCWILFMAGLRVGMLSFSRCRIMLRNRNEDGRLAH